MGDVDLTAEHATADVQSDKIILLLPQPPPRQPPYQQAHDEHAPIGDPLVHALPPIDDTQQRVRQAQAVQHIQRLPLR